VAKGILYVETRPSSPEQAADYHRWYEETHMPEVLGLDGFVSARRFEPLGDDGSFVAVYEIDSDDVGAAAARLDAATRSGALTPPVGLQLDPPPTVRFLRETREIKAQPA
jgi:hypothetical protein